MWQESAEEYAAPQGPVEEFIAATWAEILGLQNVSRHDSFFDLGGHSLLAAQVITRLDQTDPSSLTVGRRLKVSDLFKAPTVAELAIRMADAQPEEAPLKPRDSSVNLVPLSFAQQRLWFLDQLTPNSSDYIMPLALRLRGEFDHQALRAALTVLLDRHEILRTRFNVDADGEPFQVIEPPGQLAHVVDHGDCAGYRTIDAVAVIRRLAWQPFQLVEAPPLRMYLVHTATDDHTLLISMHHILGDGWSMNLLIHEVATLYNYFEGHPGGVGSPAVGVLPTVPIQYADYALWHNTRLDPAGRLAKQQLSYWANQLAGLEPLPLSTDSPRPARRSGKGAIHRFAIASDAADRLTRLAREHDATLFMGILATLQMLLARYTGSHDIPIGTPIAGRNHPRLDRTLGCFVNTIVMRGDLSGDPSLSTVLDRSRDTALAGYANDDLPFQHLLRQMPTRDLSRNPLFDVLLVLQETSPHPATFTSLDTEVPEFDAELPRAKFDLSMMVEPDVAASGRLLVTLTYVVDLFAPATISAFAQAYIALVDEVTNHPDVPMSRMLVDIDLPTSPATGGEGSNAE